MRSGTAWEGGSLSWRRQEKWENWKRPDYFGWGEDIKTVST